MRVTLVGLCSSVAGPDELAAGLLRVENKKEEIRNNSGDFITR
jgi:hypothetical protein